MVKLNKIYTRTGDDGTTGLVDGSRLSKASARVAAYGDIDETNSVIGLARLHSGGHATQGRQDIDAMLSRIQNDLFDLGADLATPLPRGDDADSEYALRIVQSQIDKVEADLDALNDDLAPLNSFVLPGGSAASAYLHLARTVARRAERNIVAMQASDAVNPMAVKYINRLSDYLFVAARWCNDKGAADVKWVPGASR